MTTKGFEEKELVRLATAGDKDAFRQLVERYQNRAFTIAFSITKSHEEAEDIVQESFVKAYLSLKKFKGESSFYTWLYRIVYNMSIDATRRKARRGGESLEFDESRDAGEISGQAVVGSVENPQEAYLRNETGNRIQNAINQLSEEHRTVIVLREFDGMSYDEISDVLGISRGTVMSRIHYARKYLQKVLLAENPDEIEDDGNDRVLSAKAEASFSFP
ncbi:MAG: sigma-70 family RNA polymerase sigma factor [Bdellovibrionales bacterium]|nr:sigma-70 family RNA polymerase sigma factor [Bdellovibrionales bacterium]